MIPSQPRLADAACRISNLTFEEVWKSERAQALQVCAHCACKSDCVGWLLNPLHERDPLPGMVAGGMTTNERDYLRYVKGYETHD